MGWNDIPQNQIIMEKFDYDLNHFLFKNNKLKLS
jgi:hypothetical protein